MNILLIIVSIITIVQSFFCLYTMLYIWDSSQNIDNSATPDEYLKPQTSFTILLPAYQEVEVLGHTIETLAKIDYPDSLNQILILLRKEDKETVEVARQKLKELKKSNLQIIIVDDKTRNKPNQLNWGLKYATGNVVTIFDAEDEVSPQILNIMNTEFCNHGYDVIQNGVQLMNYRANWFACLNVLEYYFWFKSTLVFFAKAGAMPFGGNSIFIKKNLLTSIGGWDEQCLTEDCDLGIRLANSNLKIGVKYNSKHTTREEVPPNLDQFIKQRTRWTQGFIQIIKKGDWQKLNTIKKLFAASYVLFWPLFQSFLFVYFIIAVLVLPFLNIPLWISLLATYPLLLLFLQFVFLNIGLIKFTQEYSLTYSPLFIIRLLLAFIPYQAVLTYANIRASYRELLAIKSWEKTKHINSHREVIINHNLSI
jgi:glycosyltransferase XagB